jgi:Phosphodiester glycosidase
MKRLAFLFVLAVALGMCALPLGASMVITPWTPLYKGIDHAVGTNYPDATINSLQVAHCLKVDLSDPDIQFLPTPRMDNYVVNSRETPSESVTTFIKRYGVQVATDANFYSANPGGADPSTEGVPCNLYGLFISGGQVVSPADSTRTATLLFTTNKEPSFAFNNQPPGTNVAGIFSAVTGYYPILSNGVNLGSWAVANYPDFQVHTANPRTIFGVSQDKRYFYMIIIDGRQSGYSDGSTDPESAIWATAFGAWDAINMDGGGSTVMYMADCGGDPIGLGHSSYLATGRGHERYVGSHFGVYAKPLSDFINDVKIVATDTSASILWTTMAPASDSVDYGPTPSYGNTMTNGLERTKHVATLTELTPGTTNYFRIMAWANGSPSVNACHFTTSNLVIGSSSLLFDVTKSWKYNSANLDGTNWKALDYDDSSWSGPGPGLLYFESNLNVAPRNTLLPASTANPNLPYLTYYFRTHFNLANLTAGTSLTFSNNIDDGAVFYLNGFEFRRLRMPQGTILNSTLANGFSCSNFPSTGTFYGDACTNCPDVFTIPSASLTNLVQGDNLLAVEAHNYAAGSADLVFGSALFLNAPNTQPPKLNLLASDGSVTFWWNGAGFTLQQSSELGPNAAWSDTPGPIAASPYTVEAPAGTVFYRLRN